MHTVTFNKTKPTAETSTIMQYIAQCIADKLPDEYNPYGNFNEDFLKWGTLTISLDNENMLELAAPYKIDVDCIEYTAMVNAITILELIASGIRMPHAERNPVMQIACRTFDAIDIDGSNPAVRTRPNLVMLIKDYAGIL